MYPGSFLLDYSYRGRLPEVKQQIVDMSLNTSGVRDTARVLRISTDTVLRALRKKEAALELVNTGLLRIVDPDEMMVDIELGLSRLNYWLPGGETHPEVG